MNITELATNPFVAAGIVSATTYLLGVIPLSILFIFSPWFGVKYYCIYNAETIKCVQTRIHYSTYNSHDGKALGYCVGRWFFCYIAHSHYGCDSLTMFATPATFHRLTNMDIETPPTPTVIDEEHKPVSHTIICTWSRTGIYKNTRYYKRNISLRIEIPRDNQKPIMDSLISFYDRNAFAIAFVHGSPGTGKSMLGLLLAKHYKASYISNLKPWEPSNYITSLYAEVSPTQGNPLVMIFDEVDAVLHNIHVGIPQHTYYPISITSKGDWNSFMDEIGRGMFPYLILLMTSNRPASHINELDPSYLRPGRVNVCMELTGPKED